MKYFFLILGYLIQNYAHLLHQESEYFAIELILGISSDSGDASCFFEFVFAYINNIFFNSIFEHLILATDIEVVKEQFPSFDDFLLFGLAQLFGIGLLLQIQLFSKLIRKLNGQRQIYHFQLFPQLLHRLNFLRFLLIGLRLQKIIIYRSLLFLTFQRLVH